MDDQRNQSQGHFALYTTNRPYPSSGSAAPSFASCSPRISFESRQKYIWRTDDHWVTCKGYLDDKKIRAHIEGKEIYGVRAGEYHQLHRHRPRSAQRLERSCHRQLRVIMDHFHGSRKVPLLDVQERRPRHHHARQADTHRCRSGLAEKRASVARYGRIEGIALSHNMRSISDMEIMPSQKDGWRLPLAKWPRDVS